MLNTTQAPRESPALAFCYSIAPVLTINEIRRENLLFIIEEQGTAAALGAKAEISASLISQWKNGSPDSKTGKPRQISSESCRKIEAVAGKEPGWMDRQHWPDEHPPSEGPHPGAPVPGVAHDMSPSAFDDPPTVLLGENMNWDTLPALFKAAMPDDALAPDHPRGLVFVWSKAKTPKPSSVVLVRDRHDRAHVREYHGGIEPGSWTAAATNRAYPAFDQASAAIVAVAVFRELP